MHSRESESAARCKARGRTAVVVALFALLLPAGPAQSAGVGAPTGSILPENSGKIAFARESPEGDHDIYAMSPTGAQVTPVIVHPAWEQQATWSPDGRKIAFVSDRVSTWNLEIYVADYNGDNVERITSFGGDDYQPAWSPDGTKIAFMRDNARDHAAIFVMNADGTGVERLTRPSSGWPSWSPDGRRIVFAANVGRDGLDDVYSVRVDGTGLRQLTRDPAIDGTPVWSPDGRWIAFVSTRRGSGDLYLMRPNGTGVRRLTRHPGYESWPSWSPDGQRLAYEVYYRGYTNIYTTAVEGGSSQTPSQSLGTNYYHPSWGPNCSSVGDVTGDLTCPASDEPGTKSG